MLNSNIESSDFDFCSNTTSFSERLSGRRRSVFSRFARWIKARTQHVESINGRNSISIGVSVAFHLVLLLVTSLFVLHKNVDRGVRIDSKFQKSSDTVELETAQRPLEIKVVETPRTEVVIQNVELASASSLAGLVAATDIAEAAFDMPAAERANPSGASISHTKSGRGRKGRGKGTNGDQGEGVAISKSVQFFGEKGEGRSFVFVIDCSGSMAAGTLARANQELAAALQQLHPRQEFSIIYFNHKTYQLGWPKEVPNMIRADRAQLVHAINWMGRVKAMGGTDPRDAMTRALQMKPDTIFMLTDGQIPGETRTVIQQNNNHNCTINTIGIGNGAAEFFLKQIANDNGGKYRFVP